MQPLYVCGFGAALPPREAGWEAQIPARLKRRDPRIWNMAYVAAARALAKTAQKPRSVVAGTALGALDETKNFLDGIFKDGFGSPRSFIASVHNSMAGKLSLEFAADGPNLTLCDGHNSFASAIASAALLPDGAFPSLVLAVDESIPLIREVAPHFSGDCGRGLSAPGEEGAVALLLSKAPLNGAARVRAVPPKPARGQSPRESAAAIAQSFGPGDGAVIPVESCTSFIGAALAVHAALVSGTPGRTIVASYSPSSAAYAAVEIIV